MRAKLKQLRVAIGMTQARVAAAVGVTQPNYHRWESGAAPIPEAKLKKLAKVLKTDPQTILGKHPPIEAGFYDDSVGADLDYYGEVSIHFLGGGAPLLLSISEGAFTRLHRDLQGDGAFVTVESLANQTVVIRTKALADLYFSSEAYDDYGPEHGKYANHIDIQMPDPRDWEIVEALAADGVGVEDFDPAHVQRVQERIMITDEQYQELVAQGRIKPGDLEKERAKNKKETDRIFRTALDITYQLSTGQQRSAYVDSPEKLFNAFYDLTDFDGGDPADDMIRLEAEGRHRIIFINKSALDYVVIPTHKYNEGRVESHAAELDGSSD
jgi:transcriptional regulator with XRE-family HTH domain